MDIKPTEIHASGASPLPAALPSDAARLLTELRLHQQELETQNHELRHTQLELAAARDRYRDLYDRAPVGYLTVDTRGRIIDANFTAAQLLAHTHGGLNGRPLSAFMGAADADRWHLQRRQAFAQAEPWRIELTLQRHDGARLVGQLDGLRVTGADAKPHLRVTLTDVTQQRQADTDRRAALQVMAEQESERRRLARELHDGLGQHLSVLKMNLAGRASAVSDADVASIVNAIDDAVSSVRRMATDLRPLMLDDLGLSAAVDALSRRSARQFGVQLSLHLAAVDPAPGDPGAVMIYRLLQAALPLLAGQTGVRGIVVGLRGEAQQLALSVESRCPRRDAAAACPLPDPGRWTNLREGAQLLGYALDVQATARGCERITVRLAGAAVAGPLPPA